MRVRIAVLLVLVVACHDPDDGDAPPRESSIIASVTAPPTASVAAPLAPYDPVHESDPSTEAKAFDGLQGVWKVRTLRSRFGTDGKLVDIRGNVLAYEELYTQHPTQETRKTMRLLRVAQAGSFAFDLDHRGDFKPEHPASTDPQAVGALSKGWSRRVSARLSKDGQRLTLALGDQSATAPAFVASKDVELIELEAVALTPSWKARTDGRRP